MFQDDILARHVQSFMAIWTANLWVMRAPSALYYIEYNTIKEATFTREQSKISIQKTIGTF